MQPQPTIAVLSDSPALASVVGAMLRRRQGWRVREFGEAAALTAYLHIAIVKVLICDHDRDAEGAAETMARLRADDAIVARDFQIIALSRAIKDDMRRRLVAAGVDEVIAKPMSPAYLEQRIGARLALPPRDYVARSPRYYGPERRNRLDIADPRVVFTERRSDNVISLVAHRRARAEMVTPPDA